MTSIYRALASSTAPNAISKRVSKPRVTLDSYHSTLSLRDNHVRVFSSRVTPDSYHSTLSLCDNHVRVFSSLGQHNFSAYTASIFRSHRNFGYLHGSLTPAQKFRISPRVSYTLTEISDNSTGLLHPHRNLRRLPGSLTPTQKFQNTSPGLLHPYRNLGSLPGSLTPVQKFRISPRVSYTHTEIWDTPRVSYTHIEIRDLSPGLLHPYRNSGSLPGSLTPTQDLSDTTAGLLHPNSRLLTLGD